MSINRADLSLPQEREVINPAVTDLTVEKAGVKEKLLAAGKKTSETTQAVSRKIENFAISRRDFLKISGRIAIALAVLGTVGLMYIQRYGILNFFDNIANKFTVVEEKPIDPRIIETFGQDYPEWASGQANSRYNWYLMGNQDAAFDITNIPTLGDKNNIVWLLTYQRGATWPFVTPERDGDVQDPTLYPLASEESFANRIASDLGLDDAQRADLLQKWRFLSVDPQAVIDWLKDLKSQGVESVTEDMIEFYSDPTGFVTGANQ